MTILFVVPPCFSDRELDFEIGVPIHLPLLGRAARQAGWIPTYLDMTLLEKEGLDSYAALSSALDDPSVRIVGISNHTVRTSVTTKAVAEYVKSRSPNMTVIVGGVNSTFMWRELLAQCPFIDYVIRGYGQAALRQTLSEFATGLPVTAPGIARRRNEVLCAEPLATVLASDFAAPDIEELPLDRYLQWTHTYPLMTHTGCGFSCNFCTSVMPGPYQSREVYRPVDDVVGEMRHAIDLGFKRFFVSDNVFTSRRDQCLALCSAIRETSVPSAVSWVCMTRVELVDEELLNAMRSAGCMNVAFGVETAGKEGWSELRKGRYVEKTIRRAFQMTRAAGIGTTAYVMVGAPSQTRADVEATLALLHDVDPTYRVISFFQPFPGTPYWINAETYGLSDIAPLDQWNFHEGPICRTASFSKAELVDIAVRMYLDRAPAERIDIHSDSLVVRSDIADLGEPPEAVRDVLACCDGRKSISAILASCNSRHGARARLMSLYWLSAAISDGAVEVRSGLTDKESCDERYIYSVQ